MSQKNKNVRALILDDNLNQWQVPFERMMQNYEIDTLGVSSNEEALLLLRNPSEYFCILIQDMQRPSDELLTDQETQNGEQSGLVFLEKYVRPLRPELPCLFVTASIITPDIVTRLERAGRSFILEKNPTNSFANHAALVRLIVNNSLHTVKSATSLI